jgi:hypothetical protein
MQHRLTPSMAPCLQEHLQLTMQWLWSSISHGRAVLGQSLRDIVCRRAALYTQHIDARMELDTGCRSVTGCYEAADATWPPLPSSGAAGPPFTAGVTACVHHRQLVLLSWCLTVPLIHLSLLACCTLPLPLQPRLPLSCLLLYSLRRSCLS